MSDTTHTPQAEIPDDRQLPDEVDRVDDTLAALRDHLVATFPSLEPLEYRGELTLQAGAEVVPDVIAFAKSDPILACELLSDVSVVHWPAGARDVNSQETTGWPTYTEVEETGHIDVSWILRSVSKGHWFRLRASLPDDNPVVASATAQYSSANFLEREVYDLMGVEFTGHPALTRIMMPDDWDGHPHRKDYPLGGVEVMYKGHTVSPPDERDY